MSTIEGIGQGQNRVRTSFREEGAEALVGIGGFAFFGEVTVRLVTVSFWLTPGEDGHKNHLLGYRAQDSTTATVSDCARTRMCRGRFYLPA